VTPQLVDCHTPEQQYPEEYTLPPHVHVEVICPSEHVGTVQPVPAFQNPIASISFLRVTSWLFTFHLSMYALSSPIFTHPSHGLLSDSWMHAPPEEATEKDIV
jgi:hypothetical protein